MVDWAMSLLNVILLAPVFLGEWRSLPVVLPDAFPVLAYSLRLLHRVRHGPPRRLREGHGQRTSQQGSPAHQYHGQRAPVVGQVLDYQAEEEVIDVENET